MKWPFSRGKNKASKQGIVSVYESPNSISMVYLVPGETQPTIVDQFFEVGEDQMRRQTVLTKFVSKNDLKGVPCTYVLGFSEYSLSLVDAPSVPKAEVAKAVSWTLRDILSFPVEEAIIDTFELPFHRANDDMKLLYAAIVRKTVVSRIETFINETGLELKYVDIPELALRNLAEKSPDINSGCAFVKLVSNGGKIIMCSENNLCVSRSFNLDLEDLTTEKGPETLEALSLEVQRAFDYVNSLFRKSIPNVLVLAPTVCDKMVIESSIKSSLDCEINYLKLSDHFVFENAIDEYDEPDYVFPIGAAIRKEEPIDAPTN